MQTEERNRIVKTCYDPELNAVACVAKCVAGIAIIGLIGVIGISVNESGREKLAGNAHLKRPDLQTAEAPQTAIHESGQTQAIPAIIEASQPTAD